MADRSELREERIKELLLAAQRLPPGTPERDRALAQLLGEVRPFFVRFAGFVAGVLGMPDWKDIREDLAQEAGVKLIRGSHRYDPNLNAVPWLKEICRNVVKDHLRRLRARKRDGTTDPLIVEREVQYDIDPEVWERAERVRAAVSALASADQAVVMLYVKYNLSPPQLAVANLAAQLDVGVSAIRQRWGRVQPKLRDALHGRVES